MSSTTRKMTEGNPAKLILTFAIPLMVGNMLQQAYIMSDTLIVSRHLGVTALAALGASEWLSYMMISIVQAIAQGFGIKLAQDFGARDLDSLSRTMGRSIVLSIGLTIGLTVLSLATMRPLLSWMHTSEVLLPYTSSYLGILYTGLPAVMLLNFGSSVLRSFGNSKTPLYSIVISASLNIALDLLFVRVFQWGVQGAAIATVIAQLCAGVFCILALRQVDVLSLSRQAFAKIAALDQELMRLSWPLMAQNLVISLGGLVVQAKVNTYDLSFVAGYSATNKIYGMLEMAAIAYGYAVITYIGQNYGAKNVKRMKEGIYASLVISLLTSVAIGAAMVLFGRSILSAFLVGESAEVLQTLEIAYRYLCIMAYPLPVLYILYVTRSTLQGIGNTFVPMLSGAAECATRILLALVGAIWLGSDGALVAEPAAWFAAMVLLSWSTVREMHRLSHEF